MILIQNTNSVNVNFTIGSFKNESLEIQLYFIDPQNISINPVNLNITLFRIGIKYK